MEERHNSIQETRKKNFVKIIITSIIASAFSIIIGTLIGMIDYNMDTIHLVLRALMWIANVFVSYSFAYLLSKTYKSKFVFFNGLALAFSYTFSVILVIIISGSFDYLYVTSYIGVLSIIGTVYGLYKLYKAKKKFYN